MSDNRRDRDAYEPAPLTNQALLYGRKIQLTVSVPNAPEGLDLSDFRLRFSVNQNTIETPNTCDIRVSNLSDKTIGILKKGGEFTRVRLSAGYAGNFGLLFDGNVIDTRSGRESSTDTYFDFICADADYAYNFSTVNKSLAAGHKAEDVLDLVAQSMQGYGVTKGYAPPLSEQKSPRGRVFFGMSRAYMRDLAATHDATWSIQNGVLVMIPNGAAIPDTSAIVLTSETGLVGLPNQTQIGIVARSLLNPQLKIGRRVQINNKSVQRAHINVSYSTEALAQNAFLPRVADDGFYRVIVADHYGDSRGNEFYTEIICIAMGDPLTPSLLQRGNIA